MAKKQCIFKILFLQREEVYELYARQVMESDMYGFIVVEELVFGEHSALLIDPAEEKLKLQFDDVKRTYIPIHNLLRIDEVEREEGSRLGGTASNSGQISPFPGSVAGVNPKQKDPNT